MRDESRVTPSTTLHIAGEFVPSSERPGCTFEARSPASGRVLGVVTEGTRADVDRAVRAANEAAPQLASMTAHERAQILVRIAERIEAHKEELARLVCEEQGKPLASEARVEVDEAAQCFRLWAEEGKR